MLKVLLDLKDHLSLIIKFILILSIINAVYFQFWHIMSTNIFLLILLFIPQLIQKKSDIKIPKEFEFLLLIFVVSTLFLGKFSGIVAPLFFGIAISFIGFLIAFILYASNQIKKNYFLIILFSFNLAVAFGFALEIAKYYLKLMLGHSLSVNNYSYSMMNMTYVIVGAGIASLFGFLYMKSRKGFIKKIVQKFIKLNPEKFSKKDDSAGMLRKISKGENEKQEFKSTLRFNLHTKKIDRKIEYSILKTIVAFLNFKGGTLFIGVTDKGKIQGIQQDKFENNDRFGLHFMNLIKAKVGKEFLSLINFKFMEVNNKVIFQVECKKSDRQVFLKIEKEEEFYIRAGPSSAQLKGRELVEYILRRFKKK